MRVQDILRTKGAKLSAILPDASIREAAPSSLQLKRPSSLLKNRSPRIVSYDSLCREATRAIWRCAGLFGIRLDCFPTSRLRSGCRKGILCRQRLGRAAQD